MDTIFLNSKIVNFLNLNLTDKIDLKRDEKSIALSNPSIYYKWENMKNSYNNKFKYQLQNKMINLNYQMNHTWYQIFKFLLSLF